VRKLRQDAALPRRMPRFGVVRWGCWRRSRAPRPALPSGFASTRARGRAEPAQLGSADDFDWRRDGWLV